MPGIRAPHDSGVHERPLRSQALVRGPALRCPCHAGPPWGVARHPHRGRGGRTSGAGAALTWLPAGPAALPVAALLAARLAFANLDGALARDTGRTTRRGAVLNELGDNAADLAVLAGFLALVPLWLVAAAALAATVPSWVSLAGAAAGAPRRNGGPVGKTERCLLVVVRAAPGWAVPAWP